MKKVKITWMDILKYNSDTKNLLPTKMITEGYIEKEDEKVLIISRPTTLNTRTNANYPDKNPTFYFIPKGLIEKIEEIEGK